MSFFSWIRGRNGCRRKASTLGLSFLPAPNFSRLAPAVVISHGSDPMKYLVTAMIGRRRHPLVFYAIGTYAGRKRTARATSALANAAAVPTASSLVARK